MLSRDQILAANDTAPHLATVEVPEWGGAVALKVMSGRDRERFEAALTDPKAAGGNLRARLASLCLCDDRGKTIFTEADVAALGEKSSKALHRVYEAAIKLNAIAQDSVDELEKNSGAAT